MLPPLTRYLKSNKRTLSLLDQQQWLTMKQIKQIQTHLIISGSFTDPYATGKIITFCAISHHGDLDYGFHLFQHLPNSSTFIWNTMIRAFAEKNQPVQANSLYKQMLQSGFFPNNYTFSFVLRACTELSDVFVGREFHSHIIKLGWESYDFVQNGLIHMYANCDCVISARKLFDASSNLDVISWTAMVNGYVKNGQIELAKHLFDQMPERNAISWSAMITGYAQVGMFREALELFNEMQLGGFRPNHAGIVGALSACGFLGTLDQGRWIHAYVDRNRIELDRVLGTALIDMYAKCGCIDTAWKVFNEMPERDVFAFTSMISGLANHGQSASSVQLFLKMREEGVKPNEVTFICVLSACSRMGMVEEGRKIFETMSRVYGIEPQVQHYGCLVDLLGRAGMLEEATRIVREMPLEPDSYVLGALLSACKMHRDVELGKETVESLMQRSLDHGGVHVLLSNMYAFERRWEDVAKVRKDMEDKNMKKVPGCSFIEVDGVVCEFVAGDRSHVFMEDIMSLLLVITKQLKDFPFDDDVGIELSPL
ncbi:Pentatricopeptide repeat-containing protein [Thalictrum thalictroides]|uniref:Pentatricopeptide repeat-containing protein n=1 Tax=Thalictrum thalictroides TaxID=46969 RepID=A0A7J6WHL6_THATH|nr:Pentatricopeptide repeat-containing protein [Thalictrum thalictroides]